MTAPKTKKAEAAEKTNSPSRAGVVIAILFLIFFLGSSDNQMISPLLPLIAREFGSNCEARTYSAVPGFAFANILFGGNSKISKRNRGLGTLTLDSRANLFQLLLVRMRCQLFRRMDYSGVFVEKLYSRVLRMAKVRTPNCHLSGTFCLSDTFGQRTR